MGSLRERLIALLFVLLAGCAPALAATYYVANSGNDSARGTSPSTAWATIARLNAALLATRPGDSFLLRRGDVFRDAAVLCGSAFANRGGATLASNPPKCSGSEQTPVTIGAFGEGADPVLDAADPLSLHWTLVSGSMWQATLPPGSALPLKLYVDAALRESHPLLPVPDCGGHVWNPGGTYRYLDCVQASATDPSLYVYGATTPHAGINVHQNTTWTRVAVLAPASNTQSFRPENTAVQNVQAGIAALSSAEAQSTYGFPHYPGVWTVTPSVDGGYTLLVNLSDHTDPNRHSFEATHRTYGVELEGVNHVVVEHLTVEHAFQSCILSFAYANDGGSYATGDGVTIRKNHVYNCGSIAADSTPLEGHQVVQRGGIVARTDGQYNPRLLQHLSITGNRVGVQDVYFARSMDNAAGIVASGVDGGGPANQCVLCDNFVETVTTAGIVYATYSLYASQGTTLRNNGGEVARNELTNNQGNLFPTATVGGLWDHNFIHGSYGEGIQLGGASTSSPQAPQVTSYNVIAHLGKSANPGLYNGIDCNSTELVQGLVIDHNTIVDTNSAGQTFESANRSGNEGCSAAIFTNNLVDQNVPRFPTRDIVNPSYTFYFVTAVHRAAPMVANHNLYIRAFCDRGFAGANAGGFSSFGEWAANWPDTDSVCISTDPGFMNLEGMDFHLRTSSPARRKGTGSSDVGALSVP